MASSHYSKGCAGYSGTEGGVHFFLALMGDLSYKMETVHHFSAIWHENAAPARNLQN
jgi:hypothetical protein